MDLGELGIVHVSASERVLADERLSFELTAERELSPATRRRSRRDLLVRRALVTADFVGLTGAFLVAAVIATAGSGDVVVVETLVFATTLPVWALAATLYGLYSRDERRPDHSTVDDLVPVFNVITAGTWISVLVFGFLGLRNWHLTSGLTFWLVALVFVVLARACARMIVRRRKDYVQNAIIIGAGDVGQLVGRKLHQHPEFGVRLVGFVDSEPKDMRSDLDHIPLLGRVEDILDIVRRNEVHRVVVAFSNDRHDTLLDLVYSLRYLDVKIDVVPRLFEAVGPAVGMHAVEGLPLVGLPQTRPSRSGRAAKRCTDVIAASLALIVTAPLCLWIAWRIKRDSPGPVLFRQTRLGEGSREFTLLKFRTMIDGTGEEPHREYLAQIMDPGATPTQGSLYKLERPDVVTNAGSWLRRTSLDELPQLINVLRGDMSLVGPRPCIPYETELFEPHHFDRFLVPAGMTGLWQVEARARSTFKEALDLDAAYARNWSLWLDLWLIARTPAVVLRDREATQ